MGGEIGSALSTIQDRISSTIDGGRVRQNGPTDGSGGADETASGAAPVATVVIPSPTATPTMTPTATNTPLPTPTQTPVPAPAPSATATAIPSPTPTEEPPEEAPPPQQEPPPAIVPCNLLRQPLGHLLTRHQSDLSAAQCRLQAGPRTNSSTSTSWRSRQAPTPPRASPGSMAATGPGAAAPKDRPSTTVPSATSTAPVWPTAPTPFA